MLVLIRVLIVIFSWVNAASSIAGSMTYGAHLCQENSAEFTCYRSHHGDKWHKLLPNARELDLVQRINRIGIPLEPGMTIALPHDISTGDVMDYAPLPHHITPSGQRTIIVSTSKMAWGAYEPDGTLLRWGPASTARGYCPDVGRACHTVLGHFKIYQKEGKGCFSSRFPVGRGGAPMPYCMFFHGGFAIHGSDEIPGYNASHGCVRVLTQDAQWLNHDFTALGTPVIVNP